MAKKQKDATSSVKSVKMSLTGIDNERAYSSSDVWAFYYIPSTRFEFMDDESRQSLAIRINNGLASLVTNATQSVEVQLITTSSPLNIEQWASRWRQRAAEWSPTEGFHEYVDAAKDYLRSAEFAKKEVYLAIHLGSRGSGSDDIGGQAKSILTSITSLIDSSLGNEDYEISVSEREAWEKKGRDFARILIGGHLQARPALPEEIASIYKRTLYPSMPVPDVGIEELQSWGSGEVAVLPEVQIENHRKFLKITQVDDYGNDMVGYRATLAFTHFPDSMNFPESEPWMHYASLLGTQFDMYSRFTLEPAEKVRKQVGRKIAEIKDEAENAAQANGGGGSIPLDLQERFHSATQLEYDLSRDSEPWVFARHRIVVTAPTEDILRDRVQAVIGHYSDLQIRLTWPTGDQLNLLLESQPADKVRVRSYLQRQSLGIISGGMPTANSSVGDRVIDGKGWVGPFIGETTSRIREAVFFSPHVLMEQNSPPGVLITGSPGGGKSFFAFTMTCQMALQGVWVAYIDPKGDALPMANLKGIGEIQTFDLRNGNDGILDPFSLGVDEADKILLALETIRLFSGRLNDDQVTVLGEAINEVVTQPDPSLNKVVDLLSASRESVARGLATNLGVMRRLPFARLCFSPQKTVDIDLRGGLTIVTLLGLDLPTSTTPQEDYSIPNRLAIGVMYLLTSLIRQLMMSQDNSHPKAVVIDEAWAVTATASGQKVVEELARMGRSLNVSLVLVSQNAGDFTSSGLVNSISSKFAFRTKTSAEATDVLKLLEVEDSVGNRDMLKGLNNGECLVQDNGGRVSRVQITSWNQDWRLAFDTNPTTKGKAQ